MPHRKLLKFMLDKSPKQRYNSGHMLSYKSA